MSREQLYIGSMDPDSPYFSGNHPNQLFQGTISNFKFTIGSTVALEFGPTNMSELTEKFTLDPYFNGSYPVVTEIESNPSYPLEDFNNTRLQIL